MKKFITILLLSFPFTTFAGDWDCDGAIESSVNKPMLEHLPAMDVCLKGDEILVKSDTPVSVQHLIFAGTHIGVPMIGLDLTYVQLKEGKPNFHLAYDRETNLQAVSNGIRVGIHPKGNSFFYGASFRYFTTTHQDGMILTPQVGFMGTKKFISLNATAGIGAYKEGVYSGFTPELNIGIRIRLFKK